MSLISAITPSSTAFGKFLEKIEDDFAKIRQRSYELFAGNGFAEGWDFDHWLRAERELFDVPAAELAEDDAGYRATVAVPGFSVKQLTVAATPDALTIRGNVETTTKKEEPGQKTLLSEISHKQIFRHFHLDSPIDPDKVTANLENGVLSVVMPKAAPARTVPVTAAAAKAA
jgi:HSP20 family protein